MRYYQVTFTDRAGGRDEHEFTTLLGALLFASALQLGERVSIRSGWR